MARRQRVLTLSLYDLVRVRVRGTWYVVRGTWYVVRGTFIQTLNPTVK